jgi:hypothetical protein
MAKSNNLGDFLTDIANAIREKKGVTDKINPQDFSNEIASIKGSSSGLSWTGHADVEGLKAIGWTDDDIAYYQQYGVNWNEEDDEYHKVTEDNKALYGVLTIENISSYSNILVYLPKIDTSGVASLNSTFSKCYSLVGIPMLDTSNVTDMRYAFQACYSLVCIPPIDTSKVNNMGVAFQGCYSLVNLPYTFDTSKVGNMTSAFNNCYSLVSLPYSFDTSNVGPMSSAFNGCTSLTNIPPINLVKATNTSNLFNGCYSLRNVSISNCQTNVSFAQSTILSKEAILFLIENSGSKDVLIQLSSLVYNKVQADSDIMNALSLHPNVSLASV